MHGSTWWVSKVMAAAGESGLEWHEPSKRLRRSRRAWLIWPGVWLWGSLLVLLIAATPFVVWLVWRDADRDLIYLIASQSVSVATLIAAAAIAWAYRTRPNQPLSAWERREPIVVRIDLVTGSDLAQAISVGLEQGMARDRQTRGLLGD